MFPRTVGWLRQSTNDKNRPHSSVELVQEAHYFAVVGAEGVLRTVHDLGEIHRELGEKARNDPDDLPKFMCRGCGMFFRLSSPLLTNAPLEPKMNRYAELRF
jgi:hypothetical protein